MTTMPDSHYLFPFQPIPDACPIPRGIVSLIGGIVDKKRPSFALWRDKEQIVIEASGEDSCGADLDPDDPYFEWKFQCAVKKTYTDYLEIIQGLIRYINFEATNWGYLIKDKNNQYYIRQRQRQPGYTLSSQPWTTCIPEREVEFTVWGTCADRRGIWKGKKVDVIYAWNDSELRSLDFAMIGARATYGMDLTYEVYGHLVGDDGSIIGLVTEAATGRMIKLADRALIYSAVADLQNRGCLYRGCGTNRFMIQDGKVRLIELNCIVPYSVEDRDKLEKDAELWHWKELTQLFDGFYDFGGHRIPPLRFTATWRTLDLIYPIPSPELPRGGILLRRTFFRAYAATYWPSHRNALQQRLIEEDQTDSTSTIIASHGTDAPLSSRRISTLRARHSHFASSSGAETSSDDAHVFLNSSRHSRSHLILSSPGHPYPRRAMRPGKALTKSSDTQSATDSLPDLPETPPTQSFPTFLEIYDPSDLIEIDNNISIKSVARAYSPNSYVDDFFYVARATFRAGKIRYEPE